MGNKLTTREDSTNYACTIVKLPPKQKVEGLDKLCKVTVFGNDILTQKDSDEGQLYLFFPAECRISSEYLRMNDEFRDETLNSCKDSKGYFEPTGRVKSVKFKGVISTGYMAPVSTLVAINIKWKELKEGDEFTDINDVNICKKYKIVHQQGATSKESRFNKKLKRFDKLISNQFRFHVDTSQLAKNLHLFHPEDIIVITDKWHGTSAIFSNVLINKELNWKEKIAKFFGISVIDKVYDNLYSSRSVIKNQYINKEATAGYYNEDIWKVVHNEIKDKIEQGISIYGEIVGYLASGKMIQKDYDYGCAEKEHKFLVYRITYTSPSGNVVEFSWNMIKNYCKKWDLEHVKEIFHGKIQECLLLDFFNIEKGFEIGLFEWLQESHSTGKCKYCINSVPKEGIVCRIDGKDTYSAYKLKSGEFLLKESKQLDEEAKTNEINIEDEQTA